MNPIEPIQVVVIVAQLALLVFLVENLVEVPTTYWGNVDKERLDFPKWLKPILGFVLGVLLSFAFGIGLAEALGFEFVDTVADYATAIDSILVGLVCARGSGFLNKIIDRA